MGRGGKWIKHLINDYDGRLQIEYIIDEKIQIPYETESIIYRSMVLNYLESGKYLLLSTIKDISQILPLLSGYGYELDNNLIDVRNDIGDSYLEYFEKLNPKIDFGCDYNTECEEYTGECNENIPFEYSCADSVFEEIASLDENLAYFDFGCGKGASLLIAFMHGINNMGGVELIPYIYEQAKINMNELHIECDIKNNDATTCNVNNYNCFFRYNPFVGNVFRKLIDNIEESYIKHPRDIYLIYGNPFEHKQVVKMDYLR